MIDLEFDRQHIWHPYTSMQDPLPVFPVTRAEGVYIELENGQRLVDGMASWWCMIHGYNHPAINSALAQQLDEMSHVMFGGLTHEPAIELSRLLIKLTPEPLQKIFISDSGSVAVEVAIKMAKQYWINQDKPQKSKILSLRGAYHGDTLAAMSVCDPVTGMHHIFKDSMPLNYFAERPSCRFGEICRDENLADITTLLQGHHHELAALILEPIVQGAGGMWFYSADYLSRVKELCKQHDVLLIADEIATGFGRTGKLFACEHGNVVPDILCLGKAMTGGYMSLAATLCTDELSAGISKNAGVFMHGPTFMANPLSCTAAICSINLLMNSPWQERLKNIEQQLSNELESCRENKAVQDVRTLGAIGVVEMKQKIDVKSAQAFFVSKGVWIRPFGKLLYIMPPYIIQASELKQLTQAMKEFIQ